MFAESKRRSPSISPNALLQVPARQVDPEVEIRSIVRKVKGGSQAYLISAADGHFYIAKFKGNPQGDRTLINEWVVSGLLRQLQILIPHVRLLRLSKAVAQDPELYLSIGSKQNFIASGLHLGSMCPVNPEKTAIFDFLPDKFLDSHVSNLNQFGAMFVVDRWLGQTDFRQAVFTRRYKRSRELRFDVWFIDHGQCLGGCHWEFRDSHLSGLPLVPLTRPFDRSLYQRIPMRAICDVTIDQIVRLSEEDILSVSRLLPQEWFCSREEEGILQQLLEQVCKRRTYLADLVDRHLKLLNLV